MLTRAEATRRAEVSTICSSQQDCKQDFQWPTTRTPPSSIRRRLQITQKHHGTLTSTLQPVQSMLILRLQSTNTGILRPGSSLSSLFLRLRSQDLRDNIQPHGLIFLSSQRQTSGPLQPSDSRSYFSMDFSEQYV